MTASLFSSWSRMGSLLLAMLVSYVWLIVTLRVSGKRTLAKLNAFDFVVTIALGSMLATSILSTDVALVDALVALAGLVVLQFVVSRVVRASSLLNRMIKSQPTALVVGGNVRKDAMARARVRRDELDAALRKHGVPSLNPDTYVILETDGTLSVLQTEAHDCGVLRGVEGV